MLDDINIIYLFLEKKQLIKHGYMNILQKTTIVHILKAMGLFYVSTVNYLKMSSNSSEFLSCWLSFVKRRIAMMEMAPVGLHIQLIKESPSWFMHTCELISDSLAYVS